MIARLQTPSLRALVGLLAAAQCLAIGAAAAQRPDRGLAPTWNNLQSRRGERWAVVIGISEYQDRDIRALQYADRDAKAVHDFLLSPAAGLGGYKPKNTLLLLNRQATSQAIRTALRSFLKSATPDDIVVIYFAGHGAPDPDRLEDLYLLAYDTKADDIASTGIPMTDVSEATRRVFAQDLLVIVDACHSAGVGGQTGTRAATDMNLINKVFLERLESSSRSKAIITASQAMQTSREGAQWGGGHGVFTHHLLDGLRGSADEDGDRIVTLDEAFRFVERNVRRDTRNGQIPTISQTKFDPSWPMAIVTETSSAVASQVAPAPTRQANPAPAPANDPAPSTSARRTADAAPPSAADTAWIREVNQAIEVLNKGEPASAAASAQQIMRRYDSDVPRMYAHLVLAQAAFAQNQDADAVSSYRSAAQLAPPGDYYGDTRRNAYYGFAIAAERLAKVPGYPAGSVVEEALGFLERILADPKAGGAERANALGTLARLAFAAGDSVRARNAYAVLLRDPLSYDYGVLMQAGVAAAQAEQLNDATTLFMAAAEKNPWHRDALANSAIMLLRLEKHQEALGFSERVIAVEPNNSENFQLLTLAHAGLAKGYRSKRTAAGAKDKDVLFELERKHTGLAVRYNEMRESLPAEIRFTNFTPSDDKAVATATITNKSSTTKSYQVIIEFLSRGGEVIARGAATAANVAPGGTGELATTGFGRGIAAFRYAPVK